MKRCLLLCLFLTCFRLAGSSQTVNFFDDFESGETGWIFTDYWGLEGNYSHSPAHALTDSPGGDYNNNVTSYAVMAQGVDLTGYLSATLSFWSIFSLENACDYVYIQVSADNFLTFTTIGALNGEHSLSAATPWEEYTYSLGGFLGNSDVKVRFQFTSDGGYTLDGFYVDDLMISSSYVDDQPPMVLCTPPEFYEGSLTPYTFAADLIDISGIASTFVNFMVDGSLQTTAAAGSLVSGTTYLYTLPYISPGAYVDFWLTAIDSSPLGNTFVTDTFHYIAGFYLAYDDGDPEYYTSFGPGSSQPGRLGCAVRITLPPSAPNLVTALIRNYAEALTQNDSMLFHVWDADAAGGPGADLMEPILVSPEAGPADPVAMTRIDLRPYASLLDHHPGDLYLGFTVPSGKVNLLIDHPGVMNRSFLLADSAWSAVSSDYMVRAVTGIYLYDAGVSGIVAPVSSNIMDTATAVTIRVQNFGADTLYDIPVFYAVNGGVPVADTLTDTLSPGDTLSFTFSVKADFSAYATYSIDAYTALSGDQDTANDHFTSEVTHNEFTSCDTLHYDGPNHTAIGLTTGGTFQAAALYPAEMLALVTGGYLDQVRIYIKDLPSSCILKIWGAGTPNSPGPEIFSMEVTDQIVANSWNTVNLSSPVQILGTDYWTGYQVTHGAGKFPAGIDAGPVNENSGWICLNGAWSKTSGNWNLRAVICPSAEMVDVGVTGIPSPLSGPNLGPAEVVTITVKNFGNLPIWNIPVSFQMNGGNLHIGIISDTLLPGAGIDYTFTATVNLSDFATYNFHAQTSLPADMNTNNDSFNAVVIHNEFTSCDTLHYDGPHYWNMGLGGGGTFSVAVRYPAGMMSPVVSGTIDKVMIYINDLPANCILRIYGPGTSVTPGSVLFSQNVTGQLVGGGWNTLLLGNPLTVSNADYWTGFEITNAAGKSPLGTDMGPRVTDGSWISYTSGTWSHLPSYVTMGNWNIRTVVCPTVIPGAQIEGDIIYTNNEHTRLQNSTVYLKSGDNIILQANTDATGHYFLSDIPSGNYTLTASTANEWGGSNAVDGLVALRHFVGLNVLEGLYLLAADVNGNGVVNSIDGLTILNRFVGNTGNFPAADWIFENHYLNLTAPVYYYQNIYGICRGDADGSYIP